MNFRMSLFVPTPSARGSSNEMTVGPRVDFEEVASIFLGTVDAFD